MVSAPVSREVPTSNQQRSTGQIRLTAAQREAAESAGVTEKVYAEQLQKLQTQQAEIDRLNGVVKDTQDKPAPDPVVITKEVPVGLDTLSLGQLLSAAFSKLFKIK